MEVGEIAAAVVDQEEEGEGEGEEVIASMPLGWAGIEEVGIRVAVGHGGEEQEACAPVEGEGGNDKVGIKFADDFADEGLLHCVPEEKLAALLHGGQAHCGVGELDENWEGEAEVGEWVLAPAPAVACKQDRDKCKLVGG